MEASATSFSGSSLEKSQSQFERKQARQKQLEMMEAAASGNVPAAPERSILPGANNAPAGAIESARRFLWDEDEEDGGATRHNRAYANTSKHMDHANDQSVNLMAANAFNQTCARSTQTESCKRRRWIWFCQQHCGVLGI